MEDKCVTKRLASWLLFDKNLEEIFFPFFEVFDFVECITQGNCIKNPLTKLLEFGA